MFYILPLVLAFAASQLVIWIANSKFRGYYAQYRNLDHLDWESPERRRQRFWSQVCIWGYRLRRFIFAGMLVFLFIWLQDNIPWL